MNSTQVYFGRTPKWRQYQKGGAFLDLQQSELFIMDDAMKLVVINQLCERFDVPGIESLQTTAQALEILQAAPNYLQVSDQVRIYRFLISRSFVL